MMFSRCCSIAKVGAFSVTVIGVTLVLIGWAASTGIAQAEVEEVINSVMLVPQGHGDNLEVKPAFAYQGNQCRKNKHPGCLLFKRDKIVHIVFHLPGSKNQVKNCSNAKNVITKIEVTATGADDGSSVTKGDFTGPFPLPGWLKENAFPDIDLDTGIIYEAVPITVARTREMITNYNSHLNPPHEPYVVKSFWYRITVTACAENAEGTHTTWISDPRGDNEGKN